MDIWGVQNIEAEGELLSTLTSALSSMGLAAEDIVIKVRQLPPLPPPPALSSHSEQINSRKLIISLLSTCGPLSLPLLLPLALLSQFP
jgi:hypothetical protein